MHQADSATTPTTAMKIVRLIAFGVPPLGGFLCAWTALQWGRPFADRVDHYSWLGVAVGLSLVTSMALSVVISRVLPLTRLYDMANNFEEELDSRFRSALRAGNARTILKSGDVEMDRAEQIEHVLSLMSRLNKHERLTRGHSERVRAYSVLIGEQMELDPDELTRLNWAAMLHDVGKLDVPASILTSPDRPTSAQWAVLKRHPAMARQYLQPLESWLGDSIHDASEAHHERWDGTGYPAGLAGEEIPLFARIVAVADAFDVMTHTRSYKKPFSLEHAKEELRNGASTQFDPNVVAAFLRIGDAELGGVRGWSTAIAGVSVAAESNLVSVGSQMLVATTAAGSGIVVANEPPPPPPVIAFEEVAPTTTVPPTTTAAPTTVPATTTTITTTTTTSTTTTTEKPIQLMNLGYMIKTIDQEGVDSTVNADVLEVWLDDELNQTIELDGERGVTVVLDVTDLSSGVHMVRFDLYDRGTLVSTETTPIIR